MATKVMTTKEIMELITPEGIITRDLLSNNKEISKGKISFPWIFLKFVIGWTMGYLFHNIYKRISEKLKNENIIAKIFSVAIISLILFKFSLASSISFMISSIFFECKESKIYKDFSFLSKYEQRSPVLETFRKFAQPLKF